MSYDTGCWSIKIKGVYKVRLISQFTLTIVNQFVNKLINLEIYRYILKDYDENYYSSLRDIISSMLIIIFLKKKM